MSIFKTIKDNINLISAAEHYGIAVKRNKFINCIFHNDVHPSMKLYTDHYHCYSCRAHGDVISFTAQLFGLSQYEAAKKLATDFCIECRIDNSPISQGENEITILKKYIIALERARDKYCPLSPDEELHPLYVESVRELPIYQYHLDTLTLATAEERNEYINNERRFFNELQSKLRHARMDIG